MNRPTQQEIDLAIVNAHKLRAEEMSRLFRKLLFRRSKK